MNESYDTHMLNHNADFSKKIYDDIFWVPVNTLGHTVYTNHEIMEICKLDPEIKKTKIHNLYEAIQCFQIGNFQFAEDNKLISKDGVDLVFHKSGYFANYTNEGCCSSIANWLHYLISEKYSETGEIIIISENCAGHAINYIKHDNSIYIIDLTAYLLSNKKYVTYESGELLEYRHGNFLTGILIKTSSFESFAEFFSKYMGKYRNVDFLFFHQNTECLFEGIEKVSDKIILYYPDKDNINVIGKPKINFDIKNYN